MQHSPQELKSRLDKAVDTEGNVLDMVAVLELVTILERLPLTREALETTRIGKTINLLRKKTDNSDLAKRAKKLVKKWQQLVINQLEASRNIDSPLNGSRISSPQINGALKEGKTTEQSKTNQIDSGKKGIKRKRSTSSLSNSPLTLSQEISPCTPSDISSNPSSPFIAIANTELSTKELSPCESKKPKLNTDIQERNGDTSEETGDKTSPSLNTNSQDVNNDINTTVRQNSLDSIHNDSGIDSFGSHVHTPSSQQLTPNQESDLTNTSEHDSIDILSSKTVFELTNTEQNNSQNKNTSTPMLHSIPSKHDLVSSKTHRNIDSLSNTQDVENCQKESSLENEMEDIDMEKPKDLVLNLYQEADGINGRFNDQGTWYSWTDVMPCNDGNLNILPYVILD